MTKTELLNVTIDMGFLLGAWTRFINEVALGRDVIDGTTREDGLTDTVGTRGLAMYFFPIYYRETMKAIDRLGRVPRNEGEWGGVSVAGFEAAKAQYLREQGGGGPTDPDPDPGNPLPPSDLDRIDGQLQIESGGGFVVNGRPVLPIFCHVGDIFSVYVRNEARALEILDYIASAGYHGIRFWTTLGEDPTRPDFWDGRDVGPTVTSDYWGKLQRFLAAVRDRGLVAHIAQGDTNARMIPDLRAFAYQIADVVNSVGSHVCALFEGANEDRDTGHQGAAKLAQFVGWFRERCPGPLLGLSAYTGTEDVEILRDYSQRPADVYLVHGYRDGRWWDKSRHAYNVGYEGIGRHKRLGVQGEPCGPGTDVSITANKHELDAEALQTLCAASLISRQWFTYMSGPGVRTDAHGDRLEQMPGFREVPQVRRHLPADVMRYAELWHGGSGRPWEHKRVFGAFGDNTGRADHAYHGDGRFACLLHGPDAERCQQLRQFREVTHDVRFGVNRIIAGRV